MPRIAYFCLNVAFATFKPAADQAQPRLCHSGYGSHGCQSASLLKLPEPGVHVVILKDILSFQLAMPRFDWLSTTRENRLLVYTLGNAESSDVSECASQRQQPRL